MKKPTESEYRVIGEAAAERLGVEGAKLLDVCLDQAAERGWSLKDLAAYLEGVNDVVNGLIAGWIEPPGSDVK